MNATPDPGRWRRRAMSFSALWVAGTLVWALLPVLLLCSLILDLLQRRRLAVSRSVLMVTVYVFCEAAGLQALAGIWLLSLGAPQRRQRWTTALQRVWGDTLANALRVLFGLRYEVEGLEELREGPVLLLSRHASSADTLLPVSLVARPNRLTPCFVLKRELLWDPCLDVAGQRTNNVFVARGSGGQELSQLGDMVRDLGPRELVVVFPEGTRFTPGRRARLIQRLRERGEEQMSQLAQRLRHTLPPQEGGFKAITQAAPELDIAICAHHGFEAARGMREIFNGELVGKRIQLRFQRFSRAELPQDPTLLYAWLVERWEEMDRWVEQQAQQSQQPELAEPSS